MISKILPLILVVVSSKEGLCEREHKVHNIVLYPEKHSWCQTTPIQQVVGSPGYESVTIDNNVCVGACYSYSIPKTQPAEPGELIGPYCDSCQPAEIKCYHVNLKADNGNLEGPATLQKRVQIITNCSCQTCDKIRKDDCEITDENTIELPKNLFTYQENNKTASEDFPDLFDAQNVQNGTHSTKNTENDITFKNKWKHWFELYQNETENDNKNDENDNVIKANHFLYDQLDNNEENNAKIEKDLENLPKSFGIEGVPSHHKGSHVSMGIQHHQNNIVDDDLEKKRSDHKSGSSEGHHNHHGGHHSHNHHHHLGEEQEIGMNVAHLIRGPHGSMVLSPVEAKLHIDSDALKPNSEGMVIEYENLQKNPTKVGLLDI